MIGHLIYFIIFVFVLALTFWSLQSININTEKYSDKYHIIRIAFILASIVIAFPVGLMSYNIFVRLNTIVNIASFGTYIIAYIVYFVSLLLMLPLTFYILTNLHIEHLFISGRITQIRVAFIIFTLAIAELVAEAIYLIVEVIA